MFWKSDKVEVIEPKTVFEKMARYGVTLQIEEPSDKAYGTVTMTKGGRKTTAYYKDVDHLDRIITQTIDSFKD